MGTDSVYDAIRSDERFSILTTILDGTGLGVALDDEPNAFTIFAPTDSALKELPKAALDQMSTTEGRVLAAIILRRHVVLGKYLYADDLREQASVEMMNGRDVEVTVNNNVRKLGRAHVLTPGIAAKNGVVFAVDKILRPKSSKKRSKKN